MGEEYHLLKMNNGDEVITRITDSDAEYLIIERPMVFKSFLTQDHTMRPKEVVIIKNWSIFSEEKIFSIPRSSIMMTSTPCEEAIKMYEIEKQRQDNDESIIKLKKDIEDEIDKMIDEHIGGHADPLDEQAEEDFKKMMEYLSENTQKMKDMMDKEDPTNKSKKKSPDEEMVYMNMMFPPDVIIDLVESGAIDPELFGEMYMDIKSKMKQQPPKRKAKKKPTNKKPNEKISDEYTGDEKDRKNFGNLWSDWSDDPSSKDYQ
jgi:hypothetical protein